MSARARHAPWFRAAGARYQEEVAEFEAVQFVRTGVLVWPVRDRRLRPLEDRQRDWLAEWALEARTNARLFGLHRSASFDE